MQLTFDPIFDDHERRRFCFFGITEAIGLTIAAAVTDVGIGAATAATIGSIAAPALVGAGGGALLAGVTGGNPLKGAEFGGITGFGVGAGGAIGGAVGGAGSTAATVGSTVGGAAGGALGADVTGQNPLIGAVGGGAAGLASGLSAQPSTSTPTPTPATGAAVTGAGAPVSPVEATNLGAADVSTVAGGGTSPLSPGSAAAPTTDLGSVAPAAGSSLTTTALGPISGGATTPATPAEYGGGLTGTLEANAANAPAQSPLTGPVTMNPTPPAPSFLQNVGNSLSSGGGKTALALAPAALTLLKGQPQVPSNIQPLTTGGAVTAPLIATEQQQLAEGNTGVLQPGQATQIAQYRSQAESQLIQQLANEGVANPQQDSRYIQGMATIEQNAQVMGQQFITAALTSGLSAAGDAASTLTTAANAQLAVDNQFQTALNSAMQSFGLVQGLSNIKLAA